MTGVGITFLIKNPQKKDNNIFLYCLPDYTKGKEKINIIKKFQKLEEISFQKIVPDEKSFWIQAGKKEWKSFLPLRSNKKLGINGLFILGERRTVTKRNAWVYAFNRQSLKEKVSSMINVYNKDIEKFQMQPNKEKINIDNFITKDKLKIKWDDVLQRTFKSNRIAFI